MKFPRKDLEKKLAEIAKIFSEKKEISAAQIEKWRAGISRDFDGILQKLDAKKNKIAAAISQKNVLKKFRESIFATIFPLKMRLLLGAPIIYAMIFPAIVLDIFLTIYQNIFFRLLNIPRVSRKDHFIFDRRHLPYLNILEKFNCLFCSYFNGLMSFSREVAGRTERYFCPVKNARRRFEPHAHYGKFCDYLDGENYRENRKKLRDFSDENENFKK